MAKTITAVVVAFVLVASAGHAPRGAAPLKEPGQVDSIDPALEGEAGRAFATAVVSFADAASLVERLDRARQQGTRESRARFARLWLQGLRWLLAAIPLGDDGVEPYRGWLAMHDALVIYSEPAGQWLIQPDLVWRIHDEYRGSRSAEPIAWLAVENGMPGECEGYVPCTAYMIDQLDGEYLRRHPDGVHAADAARSIADSAAELLRLLTRPDGSDFLDPARDCAELTPRLHALQRALVGSAAVNGAAAMSGLERLGAFCPEVPEPDRRQ